MAASFEFHLHVQGPTGEQQRIVPLGVTTIGRMAGSSLLLENDEVSRRHAQIICTLTLCEIIDQNSSNGTFVNGEKCLAGVPVALEDGDQIKIGPFLLDVSRVETAEPVPEPPDEEPVDVDAPDVDPPDVDPPKAPPAARLPVETPGDGDGSGGDGSPPPGAGGPNGGEPAAPATPASQEDAPENGLVPPGLSIHSQRLIHYLPGIYAPDARQQDFMSRFLGIFESILMPIEWNVDNFDLFLNPALAPADFLPWLANWFGVLLQPNWSEAQRRTFLSQAGFIFARRGTSAALQQVLAIFTGVTPEIEDTAQDLPPFTFRVRLPMPASEGDSQQIAALIEAHKPAHTSYILEFSG